MSICAICFDEISYLALTWQYSRCLHKFHFRCLHRGLPCKCPVCRAAFTDEDEQTMFRFRRLTLDCRSRSRSPIRDTRPLIPEPQLPRDYLPLCCPQLGGPPEFRREWLDRQMRWSYHGGDQWQCYSCQRVVTRSLMQNREDMGEGMADMRAWLAGQCDQHGQQAIVVDFMHCGDGQPGRFMGWSCTDGSNETFLRQLHCGILNADGVVDTVDSSDMVLDTQDGPLAGAALVGDDTMPEIDSTQENAPTGNHGTLEAGDDLPFVRRMIPDNLFRLPPACGVDTPSSLITTDDAA